MHLSQTHPPAMTATTADLLPGPRVRVRPASMVSLRSDALPRGLKRVNDTLVASQPGMHRVKLQVTRKNGTSLTRVINTKVG